MDPRRLFCTLAGDVANAADQHHQGDVKGVKTVLFFLTSTNQSGRGFIDSTLDYTMWYSCLYLPFACQWHRQVNLAEIIDAARTNVHSSLAKTKDTSDDISKFI